MRACPILIACALPAWGLAACGADRSAPAVDAGPSEPACAAAFSENFTESWTGPTNCATVDPADGHMTLRFMVPSQTISAPFQISIDLGEAPAPGTYTTQSISAPWSASALHEFEGTSCLYRAAAGSGPPSTIRLVLDALDPHPHGTLDLELYVLGRPYTYCGEANTERLVLTF